MPKFDSPIYITGVKERSANTEDLALLHLGSDNRVGISTESPESKLHVNGAITATGLVVPIGVLYDSGSTATIFGFNPNLEDWSIDTNDKAIASGWTQDLCV